MLRKKESKEAEGGRIQKIVFKFYISFLAYKVKFLDELKFLLKLNFDKPHDFA